VPPPAANPPTETATAAPSAFSVGDQLELDTGAIASGGGCVGRAPDGRVVFVRHALPGERVRAVVTAVTTNFLRADAEEVLTASAARVTPPCPHAGPGRCGGCDWQHIDLAHQRELKSRLIAEQLLRVARVEHPVVVEALPGGADGLGWRSRVRFAVDSSGAVGLRRHRSHDVEVLTRCPVATPELEALGIEAARWRGAAEVEGFAAGDGNGATVLVVPGREGVRVGDLPADLGGAGLVVEDRVLREPRAGHPEVLGRRFRVSAGAFWQVHTAAPAVLAQAVIDALEPRRGESVVDLYAGVGLFSLLLADAVGPEGRVVAVERSRAAAGDARRNAAGVAQVEVWARPVDAALAGALAGSDLVVLDPPREGAGKALTAALVALDPPPRRIAYLSCDAASFARDLRVALDAGWAMTSLRAFDVFPMTEHVELLAVLEPAV